MDQEGDRRCAGAIANRRAIHQTTASNLLDGLEKKGMVCKTRQMTDRRVVILSLTEKGRSLLSKAPEPARGLLPEALSQMKPAELKQLGESLAVLLKSVRPVDNGFALLPLPFTL